MTPLQKVIKYLAIAFAIFLIVSIISGIYCGIASVSYLSYKNDTSSEFTQEFVSDGNAKSLNIEVGAAELNIQKGDVLKAESDNEYITCIQDGDKVTIKEKRHGFGKANKHVTVYVPENLVFDTAYIETGAGKVSIDTLSAKKLSLDLGAGEMTVNKLNVNQSAEIDGGAGQMTIKDGSISNLDLDIGIGELNLTGRITGDSSVDYGIGGANIVLLGTADDYRIELDKGIGEALLEGEKMRDDFVYGKGENSIEIDGGIGGLNISFRAE